MFGLLFQTAVICSLGWILWRVRRRTAVRSNLDNLPGPRSPSFLYGNLKQLYDKQDWDFHWELGEKYGSAVLLHGRFGRKLLYVFDPKAMHAIAVKEQYIFDEAKWWLRMNHDTLGPGLLASTGDQHRRQRKMLNPTFNINHMREMLPMFYEITDKLRRALERRVVDGCCEVDIMSWMNRTALELIGRAGLGHSFDPLVEQGADVYGSAVKAFIPALFSLSGYLHFLNYIEDMVPAPLRRVAAEHLPHKNFQRLRAIVNTMHEESVKIYVSKRAALEQGDEVLKRQVGEGKDLMSILLTTVVGSPGGYTPAPFRFRETREDVVLPLSNPIRGTDGSLITEIPLPKDTMIFVGIMSCNTNKALWGEDAHEWNPDRWLSPLPGTVAEAKIPGVYSNLMTFWGGGRACIGFKFSQLEMKVVLSTLVSKYNFELTDKSIRWNLAGVVYPTVEDESHPSLPMKITRV